VARALRSLPILMLLAGPALAKAAKDVPYPLADAFSTALRFVRIDRGCHVTDKDPDAAFLTWECKDGDKTLRGSLELFRAPDKQIGHETVRLQVTLGDDPHYVELRFLELLERKLREERGTPPNIAPPEKKPPPPQDGGS
jgi:hypothetical protein